ncbi:MAG: prephenate dehydratase [Actinomycetota bacterium]|nr:prephenate dehydratase [Actinomycetota bacterium]
MDLMRPRRYPTSTDARPPPRTLTGVRVTYFGPPGTFTEEALRSQADLVTLERVAQRSVPDVIAGVERGEFELGVVPIENMIEGSVSVTLDTLAFDSDLLIQREVDLPVSLNLCAPPGVSLGDLRAITSFPHAAAQCRGWLGQKLPGVDVRAALSTADSAREVAKSKRRDQAAICNRLAAELYGLDVLATEIEDHPENQTRFVVVGRGIPAQTGHDKTSIVCFQRADRPGSLLAILQEFAARAVNLTKLESRPTKRGLGDNCFFIDCEGHVADELLADVFRNLMAKQADVKFPGSYPVGGDQEANVSRRRAAGRAWKQATEWVEELRGQIRADGSLGP